MTTTPNSSTPARHGLALGLGALALVAGAAHVVYMRVMYDDAFISYRYATNLAHGWGLVFNPGERVEGYSNFLWTLLMSVVVLAGGRPEDAGPVLSAMIALGTLALVMWFAGKRGGNGWLAGLLLAASSCWATWATGGLETALFGGLLTLGVIGLLRALETPTAAHGRWLHASAIGFGLACLTRPDGPLLAACAALVVGGLAARGRLRWGDALRWGALIALFALPHLAWRWSYYGRLVPNTYAVKPPGTTRLVFGLGYLVSGARDLWLWLLLIPVALIAVLRSPARGLAGRDLGVIAAVVVPFVAYLATTGGDFMPVFRFVAPLLPLVTLVAAAALAGIVDALRARRLEWLGVTVATVCALGYVTLNLAHSVKQQGIWSEGELVSVGWARQEVDDWLRIGDLLAKVALPSDTLATTAAGAVPYRSGLYTIDMLGLNAPDLSRYRRLANNRPGHMILLEDQVIAEHPPQILLAHPRVQPEAARLALSYDMRPEWRDRVLSHYELLGLTLLGKPVRFVGVALRADCVDRVLAAGRRAHDELTARE